MVRQVWRLAALALAAVTLTVSCGYAAAIYATEISADQVAGRWASEAGTSLTFHADHTFTSEHFDTLPVASDCDTLPPVARRELTSGRWAFDDGTAGETATRGTVLSLTFTGSECAVHAYVFGDAADPALCPTDDPDDGCRSKDYLQRIPGRP